MAIDTDNAISGHITRNAINSALVEAENETVI